MGVLAAHHGVLLRGGGWQPPSGCVLWLAEALTGPVAGGGTWDDASAANNDGVLSAGAAVVADAGLFANNSKIHYADVAVNLTGWTAFTLCGWFRRAAAASSYTIGQYKSNLGPGIIAYATLVFFGFRGTASTYGYTSESSTNWRHWAWRYDGGAEGTARSRVWANGGEITLTYSGTPVPVIDDVTDTPFRIGAQSYGTMTANAYHDDIQLFTRALTEAEIQDIYANSPGSHTA